MLRFRRHDQEYKTPLNITIGRRENPDRPVADDARPVLRRHRQSFHEANCDISGVGFTLFLFIVFTISSRMNAKARQ